MTMSDADSVNNEREANKQQKKPPKRGIIYLSTIPPYINVSKICEIFSEFGVVGRVYLQLADTETQDLKKSKRRNAPNKFTEGWIEFERKSVAKKVALLLNNKQVSTRKKSKHYDCLWSIKYLSGFKWTHLHERLAYEKAVKRKKLSAEVQLAKKKSSYFSSNVDKKKKSKSVVNKELLDFDKRFSMSLNEEQPSSSTDRGKVLGSIFAEDS